MKYINNISEFTTFLHESCRGTNARVSYRLLIERGVSIVRIIGWQEIASASYNDFQVIVRFSKDMLNHFLNDFPEKDQIKIWEYLNNNPACREVAGG